MSGTLGAELEHVFGRVALVGLVRAYGQRHAGFYVDRTYPTQRAYMTMDRELSRFVDATAGATLRYRSQGRTQVRFEVRALASYFRYLEFYRLPERVSMLVDVAVGFDR